jgi:hypothetical protein
MFGLFNKSYTKDKVINRMLERLYEEIDSSVKQGNLNRIEVERIQIYIQKNKEVIKSSAIEFSNRILLEKMGKLDERSVILVSWSWLQLSWPIVSMLNLNFDDVDYQKSYSENKKTYLETMNEVYRESESKNEEIFANILERDTYFCLKQALG